VNVVLPFESPSVIFYGIGSRSHVLHSILLQQMRQFAGQAIPGGGKKVPCLVECLEQEVQETREGWTVTHSYRLGFGDPNHSTRAAHTLVLLQEFAPIPGAQPADRSAMIDQVEETLGKFEHPKRVHHMKLYAVADL